MNTKKCYKNNSGDILKIARDCYPSEISNPMNWDTLFNYYTWQKRYFSMQENSYLKIDDWFDAQVGEDAYYLLKEQASSEGKTPKEFVNMLCSALDKVGIIAFPIRVYEQTDKITYYLGEWFDCKNGSLVGFAWQTKENLYKEYRCKRISSKIREKIKGKVETELEIYTLYCNDEVYSFELYDRNGDELDAAYEIIADGIEDMFEHTIDEIKTIVDDLDFVEVTEEVEKTVA